MGALANTIYDLGHSSTCSMKVRAHRRKSQRSGSRLLWLVTMHLETWLSGYAYLNPCTRMHEKPHCYVVHVHNMRENFISLYMESEWNSGGLKLIVKSVTAGIKERSSISERASFFFVLSCSYFHWCFTLFLNIHPRMLC